MQLETSQPSDIIQLLIQKEFQPIVNSLLSRLACRDFLGVVYGFKSIIMAPAVMSDNITHLCSFNFEVLSHAGENVLASLRLLYKIESSLLCHSIT